jgi:hypothetical protein
LFAIPLNQEFVFIEDQNLDVLDTTMLDVNRALKYCLGIMEENTRENKPPPRNGWDFVFKLKIFNGIYDHHFRALL